jgi:hypothetical protein
MDEAKVARHCHIVWLARIGDARSYRARSSLSTVKPLTPPTRTGGQGDGVNSQPERTVGRHDIGDAQAGDTPQASARRLFAQRRAPDEV